jgi:predicted DsbA family dithiol-disulfide isomerase
MQVPINVTSDFICPWCYIAEARLAKAIDSLPDDVKVDVWWLPFELNPDLPEEGLDRRAYRSAKFGSWAHSQLLDAKTVEAGRGDGVAFEYDAMHRTPNTLLAHRLAIFAGKTGRQSEAVAAILKGYFAQGRDIGSVDDLLDIAAETGLDRAEAAAFLAGDGGLDDVRTLEQVAAVRGVRSVPHIEIAGTVINGAQSVEALRDAILAASARLRQPETA